MNSKSGNRTNQGFSLIEVMIALSVLGIMMMSFAQLFGQQYEAFEGAQKRMQAISIGKNFLEEILVAYSADPRLSEGLHEQQYTSSGQPTNKDGVFKVSWSIEYNNPIKDVIFIDLKVTWQEREATRGVSYLTYRGL